MLWTQVARCQSGCADETTWVGRVNPVENYHARAGMWVGNDGELYFTCQDLHDAGVTTQRFGSYTHHGYCCDACHGWGEWRDHPCGRVIHQLPNGHWVICCCCYTFDKSDKWLIKKLNAWRRAVRRARR